ncbi:MAG TPA: alpha/beta fold hydrolase [Dehalococcoidia bacterium]|nr:alpha/beta fold hydrolase [Dehalococcoidia bacterium]
MMNSTRISLKDKPGTLSLIAVAVITVHVINASLFHLDAALAQKLAWTALALAAAAMSYVSYPTMNRLQRSFLALAYGLPAGVVGGAVHVAHVYELGVENSSWTGIPMLVAGVLLTVIGGTMLVRSVHDWWRRLAFVPAGVLLGFFVLFPVTLGVFATNIPRVPTSATETPAERGLAYENVSFQAERGNTLHAWFIPSSNGATIITVHGAGKNRSTVMDEAEMLVRNGYGVLMVDLEGFGDSEGRGNAFGWTGARSVHAATAYLATRDDIDPSRIGGLGLSMGGEVLLQAAGESTDLKAIVAEGSTARTAADFRELKSIGEIGYVLHTVVGATMRAISGEDTPPPLMKMVPRIAPRDVLLIGSQVADELDLISRYKELGGESFDIWFIPEAKHIGGFDLHPEEYEQRVIAFFDESLLQNGPPSVTAP